MFAATATTLAEGNMHCLGELNACVFVVFQNQTSQTLHNLTIAITNLPTFSFLCPMDLSQIAFFSSCSGSDDHHVTFSGGTGILPAIQSCVAPTAVSALSCQKQFTGGEFGLLIDATASEGFAGQSVTGQTITTPEPDAAIMILSAALAFGLLKLLRRGA
jgi:hypothetical protein